MLFFKNKHTKSFYNFNHHKRNVYWSNDLFSIKYIPTRYSMTINEIQQLWYSVSQIEQFAKDEVKRRNDIGVESKQILCSEVFYSEY